MYIYGAMTFGSWKAAYNDRMADADGDGNRTMDLSRSHEQMYDGRKARMILDGQLCV